MKERRGGSFVLLNFDFFFAVASVREKGGGGIEMIPTGRCRLHRSVVFLYSPVIVSSK